MQQYVVGGAVRDVLLNVVPKDIDYVWVGATPEDMISQDMNQVGVDFPVFLDSNGDEHALARKERKAGDGYNGFECEYDVTITLKDDQYRRDLTINQMAVKVEDWGVFLKTADESLVIDSCDGIGDLHRGTLRHISAHFCDDPVRLLRTARFAARYGFAVDAGTVNLMKKLVDDGELNHLTAERVWSEFEKAMSEDSPSVFFWTLDMCGAKELLFPELGNSLISTGYHLKQAALLELPTIQRMMIIFSGIEVDEAKTLLTRLKAPTDVFQLSRKMRLLGELATNRSASAEDVLETLQSVDAFGNTGDMKTIMFTLLTCRGANKDNIGDILSVSKDARNVTFASLTPEQRKTLTGKDIGNAINELRLEKIKELF